MPIKLSKQHSSLLLLLQFAFMISPQAIALRDGRNITMRLLSENDSDKLYAYLSNLSLESLSRFGPHSFDKKTVDEICHAPQADTNRFVAEYSNKIIAYMLLHPGLVEGDVKRISEKNILRESSAILTYAPSVADEFQSSGLGSQMLTKLIAAAKKQEVKTIVLWGGVQATNKKALRFYEKNGFVYKGSFWLNEKDNFDMILEL